VISKRNNEENFTEKKEDENQDIEKP